MSNAKDVCRLCLNIVPTDKCSPFDPTITEKMQLLMPEMKLTPSTNIVICSKCKESLEESCKLKRTCSSSNKLIRFLKNYLGVTHTVELKELIKGNNRKHDENWPKNGHVCRICLKSNEGAYSSITDAKAKFGLVLSSCLLTLDEHLTTDPQICKICIDALQKMSSFIKQCVEAEDKVKAYSQAESNEIVDLFKVIDSVSDEERDPPPEQSEKPQDEKTPMEETGNEKFPLTGLDLGGNSDLGLEEGELNLLIADQRKNISELVPKVGEGELSDFTRKFTPQKKIVPSGEIGNFSFKETMIHVPFKRKVTLKQWLDEVEALKTEKNWSDLTVITKVMEKLQVLRPIHNLFQKHKTTWPEFKEKLLHAFPGPDDYYMNILEMTQRKRMPKETFVEYYQEKMSMLRPFNFTDEQNVSFLLGGIRELIVQCEARMARYKKPEDVLAYLKTCDNSFTAESLEMSTLRGKKRSRNRSRNFNFLVKCACCDQNGHSSLDCPLIKVNKEQPENVAADTDHKNGSGIVVLENRVIASGTPQKTTNSETNRLDQKKLEVATNRSEKPGSSAKQPQPKEVIVIEENVTRQTDDSSKQKCTFCDQSGHSSLVCPLIDNKEQSPSQRSTIKIVLDKDRLGKANRPLGQVEGTGKEDLICEVKERPAETKVDSRKKCSCCDKLGHTSLDCPLLGPKKVAATEKTVDKAKTDQKKESPQKKSVQASSKERKDQKNGGKSPHTKNTQTPTRTDQKYADKTPQKKSKHAPSEVKRDQKKEDKTPQRNTPSLPKNANTRWSREDKNTQRLTENTNTKWPTENTNTKWSTWNTNAQWSTEHTNTNWSMENFNTQWSTDNFNTQWATENTNTQWSTDNTNTQIWGQNATPQMSYQWCTGCNEWGHSPTNCPLLPFLNQMQKIVPSAKSKNESSLSTQKTATEQNEGLKDSEQGPSSRSRRSRVKRCLCCNNVGHSSLDCPLLRTKKKEPPKPDNSNAGPYNPRDVEKPPQRCTCCNKGDHAVQDCPFYGFLKGPNSNTGRNVVPETEPTPQSFMEFLRRSDPSRNEEEPPAKRAKEAVCYFCDKPGHTSVDCFRTRFEQMQEEARGLVVHEEPHSPYEPPETFTDPSVISFSGQMAVCQLCNSTGHSPSECFYARFERKTYEAQQGGGVSRQCQLCGKFGHAQPDCPKRKDARTTAKSPYWGNYKR